MITKQELINKMQDDRLSMQFVQFLLDDRCPTDIPAQNDENSIALRLLRAVSDNDRKAAAELLAPISKRHIGETSVWISNDLFFVSLAISSLKFAAHRDFVHSVAVLRSRISAGGSHRGLAQAVLAAMTGNPDFTQSAAIFSLALTRYLHDFEAGKGDILNAYDSFQSYDWDIDRHSPVCYALALAGLRDILKLLDLVGQRGAIKDYCIFAQSFPRRITQISRLVAWGIAIIIGVFFVTELLVLSIFLCKIFIGQFFEERQVLAHFSYGA